MNDDINVSGGIGELFYVLDLGDYFGSIFERVLAHNLALALGHLASFALNGAIWGGYATVVAMLIASKI